MKKSLRLFLAVVCFGLGMVMTSCSGNKGEELAEQGIIAIEKGDDKALAEIEKKMEELSEADQKAAKAYMEKNQKRVDEAVKKMLDNALKK